MVHYAIPKDYPNRKHLIEEMQEMINSYWTEHPNATYEQLEKRFGKPEELAASLIDSLTSEEVLHLFNNRKKAGHVLAAFTIAVSLIIIISLINLAERNRAAYITEELIIYDAIPEEE
jgi:hypothetical protein